MKILNINSYYYSSTVHNQLQKALLNNGIDTFTYVPLVKGYVPREECKNFNDKQTLSTECYTSRDRFIFQIKHKKIFNDLQQRLNFKDFDCIHAHSLFSNGYIALKIKRNFGLPYIVVVRDTDVNVFFRYMIHLRNLGIEILMNAEKIIFLSESYKDFVIDNFIPKNLKEELSFKSEVIPNGIDEFWHNNKGKPNKLNRVNSLRLLYVGTINKRKNITTTTKAIEILLEKGYQVNFKVVGKIEDENVFRKINKLSFVQYIEPKQKQELIDIYRQSDIFVMPSIAETFGLTYAEAMSQGIPVIYSSGQGFDKQFEDGIVGYSVNSRSVENIVNNIISILNNYEAVSNNCINKVNKFNWRDISMKYKDIYSKIIVK